MKKKYIAMTIAAMVLVCLCGLAFAENEIASQPIRLTLIREEAPAPAEEETTPSEEEEIPTEEYETQILPFAIDVRLEADGMSEIIATLEGGTEVAILSVEGHWAHITAGDVDGYTYVTLDDEEEETASAPAQQQETVTPTVEIFTSRRSEVQEGETITLSSVVYHAEGYELLYQWQCDKGDGWSDIDGANGETYQYEANARTLTYSWRLNLLYRPIA